MKNQKRNKEHVKSYKLKVTSNKLQVTRNYLHYYSTDQILNR